MYINITNEIVNMSGVCRVIKDEVRNLKIFFTDGRTELFVFVSESERDKKMHRLIELVDAIDL